MQPMVTVVPPSAVHDRIADRTASVSQHTR